MTTARTPNPTTATVRPRRLALVTIAAAAAAAVVNALVYAVGSAAGAFPQDVIIQAGMPMTLFPVVSLTILASLAAGGAYALLGRMTKRPTRAFVVLAVVVLVAMAIPPFTIAGAPAAMNVALQVMHLTAAAIVVYALTRYAAPR